MLLWRHPAIASDEETNFFFYIYSFIQKQQYYERTGSAIQFTIIIQTYFLIHKKIIETTLRYSQAHFELYQAMKIYSLVGGMSVNCPLQECILVFLEIKKRHICQSLSCNNIIRQKDRYKGNKPYFHYSVLGSLIYCRGKSMSTN